MEIWMFLLLIFLISWVDTRSKSEYRPHQLPSRRRLGLPGGEPGGDLSGLRVEQGARIGQRTGIKVHADVELHRCRGRVGEYAVRFELPSGVPVRSRASRYRDHRGGVSSTARTKVLRHDPSRFRDLWIFLPYGAFDLPCGVHDLDLYFSMTLVEEGGSAATPGPTLVLRRHRFTLVQPEGEERAAALPRDAVRIEDVARGEGVTCGVCNEAVSGRAYVCPRCDALHHLDCWEYNQGCTTYGCGERSVADERA